MFPLLGQERLRQAQGLSAKLAVRMIANTPCSRGQISSSWKPNREACYWASLYYVHNRKFHNWRFDMDNLVSSQELHSPLTQADKIFSTSSLHGLEPHTPVIRVSGPDLKATENLCRHGFHVFRHLFSAITYLFTSASQLSQITTSYHCKWLHPSS